MTEPPRPTLLLTRPEAASHRFANAFRARFGADWPVVIAPLMRLRHLSPQIDLTGIDGLIFTSEAAVDAFCRISSDRSLPAWCVGKRTAEEAAGRGINAQHAGGDAKALAAILRERQGGRRLLWPHGQDRAVDLPELLNPAGIETISVETYVQEALPLTAEARALLAADQPVLLPLFSPRSARLFLSATRARTAPLWIAALSPAVAAELGELSRAMIRVAARPDGESLLDCLAATLGTEPEG
ncbi:uroporphyrinogen-III synthase [Frigidibacter sp. RF13]|uniref:uroporphyrinogen-III synthase n=1 Tax=Frigidibacter sp. RF13 TaxID=2997340 RepID=UPI00226DE21F|nr:uroporphyrinogen-III synthase [Frigidibacter sp. RF13]MCY1126463.1 uroporphyrinogen-III synthase [Frigidibacter sp. RF13]